MTQTLQSLTELKWKGEKCPRVTTCPSLPAACVLYARPCKALSDAGSAERGVFDRCEVSSADGSICQTRASERLNNDTCNIVTLKHSNAVLCARLQCIEADRWNRNTDENSTCDGSCFLSNVSRGASLARYSNRQLILYGCVCYTGLMAEFVAENCGVSSPSGGGKPTQPCDEEDGRAASEVSVSNGDCGPCAPENQGLDTANGKTGIPRKTSIIKVNDQCICVLLICRLVWCQTSPWYTHTHTHHPQVWVFMDAQKSPWTYHCCFHTQTLCSFEAFCDWFHDGHQSDEVTCAPLHIFLESTCFKWLVKRSNVA